MIFERPRSCRVSILWQNSVVTMAGEVWIGMGNSRVHGGVARDPLER